MSKTETLNIFALETNLTKHYKSVYHAQGCSGRLTTWSQTQDRLDSSTTPTFLSSGTYPSVSEHPWGKCLFKCSFKKLHNLTYLFSYGNDNPDYYLKYFLEHWEVYRTEQALCPTRWEEEWGEAGELSLTVKLRSSFKHQLLTASSEVRTGFKTMAKECYLKFPWSELIFQGQKWSLSLANVVHACVLKFKPSYNSGSITKGEANHSNSLTRNIWCKWCRAFYPSYRRKIRQLRGQKSGPTWSVFLIKQRLLLDLNLNQKKWGKMKRICWSSSVLSLWEILVPHELWSKEKGFENHWKVS